MKSILICSIILASLFWTCHRGQPVKQEHNANHQQPSAKMVVQNDSLGKIIKSAEEWRSELTEQEYYVLREKGTERAFTGDLLTNKKTGIYTCAGCQLPLFSSDTKYKSGTGWPSFWQPIKDAHIAEETDNKYGWNRVEVLCARCDGHLGHVFSGWPKTYRPPLLYQLRFARFCSAIITRIRLYKNK